jgi:hypothetical protein
MTTAQSAFPAVGHTYEITMGSDVFLLTFESPTTMHAVGIKGPNKGFDERENITLTPIREGLFMLSWQEASGTTSAFIEDFEQGISYAHITIPDDDGTVFLRFEGTLRLLQ